MGFRFVHTADWQLGKVFRRFGTERAARLQDARLGIVQRVADLARAEGAKHVLVAGDVWDQEVPSDAVLRQPLGRMAQASELTWWLLPGNHDPAKRFEESLWDRIRTFGVPDNVRLLTEPEPQKMEEGVTLLPAPWTSKKPGTDLTAWFGGEGQKIGLAHGSTRGFSSRADDSAVIAEDRAEAAELAYLALGDWHGMTRAAPRTYYAGTPEADGFRNNEQGKALVVDLDEPDAPAVHHLGSFDWQRRAIDLGATPDLSADLAATAALDRTLLRLKLSGTVSDGARAAAEALIAREEGRYFLLEADWEGVATAVALDELQERLGAGVLGRVAGRLTASDEPEAQEALRLLSSFAGR